MDSPSLTVFNLNLMSIEQIFYSSNWTYVPSADIFPRPIHLYSDLFAWIIPF